MGSSKFVSVQNVLFQLPYSLQVAYHAGFIWSAVTKTAISNAVQFISLIFLLKSRQLEVLRASLMGAMLSNLLLMTGLGFLFGGFNRLEQYFHSAVA